WDFEKYSEPEEKGGRYFYRYNTGLQNQSVLYSATSLDGEPKPLLDPNTLSADGTVALAGLAVTDDGKRLASALAEAGSDWLVWKDDEHKDWQAHATVTDDGKYLVLTLSKGTDDKYRILFRPLEAVDAEPKHLVGNFEHEYTFIDNDGGVFWFKTDKDAPR